jgi:hypothetical protein
MSVSVSVSVSVSMSMSVSEPVGGTGDVDAVAAAGDERCGGSGVNLQRRRRRQAVASGFSAAMWASARGVNLVASADNQAQEIAQKARLGSPGFEESGNGWQARRSVGTNRFMSR